MTKIRNLTAQGISNMLGTNVDNLGQECLELINSVDLRYEELEGEAEKDFILDVLKKIHSDEQVIGAPERTNIWNAGWSENLRDFKNNKDKQSIVPKFIRPNNIIRLNGKFCNTINPYFERDFAKIIQLHLYNKFITDDIKEVHEFGCGSGFNLINLSEVKPNLKLNGSDFVQSSVDLIKELSLHYGLNLESVKFNMLEPDYDYQISRNSCVFTHGAIEQLASKYEKFIDFLLVKKPKVCFHIEPVCEVYKDDTLFDFSQFMFHKKRGYTSGLLPHLQTLSNTGKIKDFWFKRVHFGSKFMEGYTIISWRPV